MITRFGNRLARLASLALGAVAASVAVAMAAAAPANAQAAYGSYIGIGPAFGDGEIGVAINGRYNILELPISIRGAAFLGEGSAFVPTISYDYPLNFNTDIFVDAGVAFASEGSVMGDGTAFVLQPGVDFITDNNLVFYGNAVVPIGGDTNTAIQGGIGYQF